MSALAHAAPTRRRDDDQRPRVEIVTTRAQRRARPRVAYVAVCGILGILLAQLLLSIVLSQGAYRIAGLTGTQRELSRVQESLNEQLELVGSTQSLAASAAALGMVSTVSPALLRLSDGELIGAAAAAVGTEAEGADLVSNSLLGGLETNDSPVEDRAFIGTAGEEANTTTEADQGNDSVVADPTDPLVSTPATQPDAGTLPSPVTR